MLIQIADDSGNDLVDGAVDYEAAIAAGSPQPPPVQPSPDDLYVLYTGGTTGMPKGVLWRQHDIFMTSFGGRDLYSGKAAESYAELVERAAAGPGTKLMVLPPLIHGAAQWGLMTALTTGQSVVFASVVDHFDADDVVATIEREKVMVATVVGDAMARPLAAAIERGERRRLVAGGGGQRRRAAHPDHQAAADRRQARPDRHRRRRLLRDGRPAHPHVRDGCRVDRHASSRVRTPSSCPRTSTAYWNPAHDGMGWLAQRGYVPLGYKGDAAKTAATFPVVGGVRYAVPGDRARHLADGNIELLGRDSVTINSGGEKIFAEEVETAIASHPAIADVVVAGRPSERWGQEVVAVVALADGASADADELIAHAAKSLARYKLPKAVVFRPVIERSPAGKADYRWAREQAST